MTFDPGTGTGFVGKGDLQIPWGWNDQTLQAQAGNVTFAYAQDDSTFYSVTCEFDTGPLSHRVHHVVTTHKTIGDTVAYDVTNVNRKNPRGKVTGFNLTGPTNVSQTSSGGDIPVIGASCPEAGNGLITDVQADPSTSTGTLSASDTILPLGPTVIWTTL